MSYAKMLENGNDFDWHAELCVVTGELWGVYCEDLGENWPRYNGTALYCSSRADPAVVFPVYCWYPPQDTSQSLPPAGAPFTNLD